MKYSIKFTAAMAKELRSIPAMLDSIEITIKNAAGRGEEGVDIDGRLPVEVNATLVKEGYEMTYKSECNTTWIYWGHWGH